MSSFERNIEIVKDIVNELGEGSVSLEDAIALYEKGKKLLSQCEKQLKDAETKITVLERGESADNLEETN